MQNNKAVKGEPHQSEFLHCITQPLNIKVNIKGKDTMRYLGVYLKNKLDCSKKAIHKKGQNRLSIEDTQVLCCIGPPLRTR